MRTFAGAVALLAIGCSESEQDPVESVKSLISANIAEDPRVQFFPEQVAIQVYHSRVIPGVRYYIGRYAPPNTHDFLVSALVLETPRTVTAIRSPADWVEGVAPLRVALDSGSVVTVCDEIARVIINSAIPPAVINLYESQESISGYKDAERSELLQHLVPPSIARKEGGWTIRIWEILPDALEEYRCEIGARRSMLSGLELNRLKRVPRTFGYAPKGF